MSSALSNAANFYAKEICQSEKARSVANAVAPTIAEVVITGVSGNAVAGKAAGQVTRVAAAGAPQVVAEVTTACVVGVVLDILTPVAIVGVAGYGIYRGIRKLLE